MAIETNSSETPSASSAIATLRQPLKLPCGVELPGRLVKCPMQETLASPPDHEPPIVEFRRLYSRWARAGFGLILTGQVRDPRSRSPVDFAQMKLTRSHCSDLQLRTTGSS